jgi:hypothetical protein
VVASTSHQQNRKAEITAPQSHRNGDEYSRAAGTNLLHRNQEQGKSRDGQAEFISGVAYTSGAVFDYASQVLFLTL